MELITSSFDLRLQNNKLCNKYDQIWLKDAISMMLQHKYNNYVHNVLNERKQLK